MMTARFRTAALAVVASLVFPATALAGEPGLGVGADVSVKAEAQGKKGKKREAHFPMKADKFRAHVSKRAEKARTRLEQALEKRALPKNVQIEVRKEFESGLLKVNAAVDAAAKDGVVTKDEAQAVRDLAKQLRKQAREKIKVHGKAKADAKAGAGS